MEIKRNTVQRTLVLETVNFLKNHATADEVYHELVKNHPTISRATVYRNLNQLALHGEIKKVEVPNGADRFDHMCFDHYHAKCGVCGKIFDVKMKHLGDLEKNIENTDNFDFNGHDIMFNGVCHQCKTHN